MGKNIHLLLFISAFLLLKSIQAQDSSTLNLKTDLPEVKGYYQTLNLDAETPCSCSEKTTRTYDLAKGLLPNDVTNYQLHAYRFTFAGSTVPVSKLFKAFEKDLSVYKISVKEWEAFMLLTTEGFDLASFEAAALKVFGTIASVAPEEFLKIKNKEAYDEYIQEAEKTKQQQLAQPQDSTR